MTWFTGEFLFYREYLSFSYQAYRCGFVQIYSKVIEFISALTSGRIAVVSSKFIHQLSISARFVGFPMLFGSNTFVILIAGLDLFLVYII